MTVLVDLVLAAVGTLPAVVNRLVEVLESVHSLTAATQRTNPVLELIELLEGHFFQQVENRGEFLTFPKKNGLVNQ